MGRINLKGRKSKGKQKINIEKREDRNDLHVAFSKRRSGIFKKAAELCVLCGTHVAIVVFSPGQKVFSFGHPNVEEVIHNFLNNIYNVTPSTRAPLSASQLELNNQIMQLEDEIADEGKSDQLLDQTMRVSQSTQRWWEAPMEELCLEQLQELLPQLDIFEAIMEPEVESTTQSEGVVSPLNGINAPFRANESRSIFDGGSSSVGVGVGVGGSGGGSAFPFNVDYFFNNAYASGGSSSNVDGSAPTFNQGGEPYIFGANSDSFFPYAGGGAPFNGGIGPFDTTNIHGGSSSFIGSGGGGAPPFNGGVPFDTTNIYGGSSSFIGGGDSGAPPFNGGRPFDTTNIYGSSSSFIGGGDSGAPPFNGGRPFDTTNIYGSSSSFIAGGGGGAPPFNDGGPFDTTNIYGGSSSSIGGGGFGAPTFHGGISLEPNPSGLNDRVFNEPSPNIYNERVPFDASVTGVGGFTNLPEVDEGDELSKIFQNLK